MLELERIDRFAPEGVERFQRGFISRALDQPPVSVDDLERLEKYRIALLVFVSKGRFNKTNGELLIEEILNITKFLNQFT